MLKKISFLMTSVISIFLLSSCSPEFNHILHRLPHPRGYFDLAFGPHFAINGILNIIIKILIIVALVFLVKMLYDKDKNNKKE